TPTLRLREGLQDTPTLRLREGVHGGGRIEDAPTVRTREADTTTHAAQAGRPQPWHAQEGFREPSRIGHWTFPGDLVRGLMSGIKESVQLSGGMMNQGHVWRVTFHDGSTAVMKDVVQPKVIEVEAQLARRRADSEELASLVYEAVGARAPRVYRMGPARLLMEHLDGFQRPDGLRNRKDVLLIGLGDALVLNTDRWRNNFMSADDGRVAGIDHEFCFSEAADLLVPRGMSNWPSRSSSAPRSWTRRPSPASSSTGPTATR
ncbi:hypothetical protein HII36_45775, partial [Nonomuraea sp. NN258]|uniref:hypothetical protein n=1 Tax=Nonomuraea antri TaxID=2730852 RepID=UPI001C2CBBCC